MKSSKRPARMITEPKIYLVSRPVVDWQEVAKFLKDEGLPPVPESVRSGSEDSTAIVEVSARLCYMSFGRGRKDISDFITNLLASKDGSVLEHVNYGFVLTGVSRSLTHELVRHRAGFAYSQRSQRYVDEADCAFVVPPAFATAGMSSAATAAFEASVRATADTYNLLVASLESDLPEGPSTSKTDRRKAVRQAARSVLPNATETKIFVTGNVRAWRHFIETRAGAAADVEIRRLALGILAILQKEAPLLFGDFFCETLPGGTQIAKPKYSKV